MERLEAGRARDLRAVEIGQVEDVDGALAISGDMGLMDRRIRIVERAGEAAFPVVQDLHGVSPHLDNAAEALRGIGIVVDHEHAQYPRRHFRLRRRFALAPCPGSRH